MGEVAPQQRWSDLDLNPLVETFIYRGVPIQESGLTTYMSTHGQSVMIAQWDSSLSSLWPGYPDHGGVFQGIFPWLITCAALYIVQGETKEWSGAPLEKKPSVL